MMPLMIAKGRRLTWNFDALDALRRWPTKRRALLLHSGRVDPRWARYSVLTSSDGVYQFNATPDHRGQSTWIGGSSPAPAISFAHRPFTDLRAVLASDRQAMWVGYLGYDLGRFVEKLPANAVDDRHWPVMQMERCPGWLVYDGVERAWFACGAWRDSGEPDLAATPPKRDTFTAGDPRSVLTRPQYEAKVARVREYIAAGDVFQVNIAQRFSADFTGDPRTLFSALADASPAWYGAYLELTGEPNAAQRTVASTSPELFLQVEQGGRVVTRPIKGTRPATAHPGELLASEKDAAELHMIVDLLRNDLGRVCAYGSVRVEQPRTIESHPTVHHGVATVTGELHPSRDLVDLLRATVPGGSITGAPKVRAMQIIDELEPVRRGVYCGAIGFIRGDEARFNIAIRTLLVEQDASGNGRVDFSVGGGIVADSEPAAEYQETLDKAAAMQRALGMGSHP